MVNIPIEELKSIEKGGMIINPVYSEFIDFLKMNGLEEDLKEGYYWLDKMIIRAFDKQGNQHKILRIYVDKDFSISFKKYKTKEFEIETWLIVYL